MENPWTSTPVWLAAIAMITQLGKSFIDSRAAADRHREDVEDRERSRREAKEQHSETNQKLEQVKAGVNGQTAALLKVTGDARQAVGNLAGRAEQKAEADKP